MLAILILISIGLVVANAKKRSRTAHLVKALSPEGIREATENKRAENVLSPSGEKDKANIEQIINRYIGRYERNRGRYQRHHVDDLTRDCVREIVQIEPSLGPEPHPGEYLWRWRERANSTAKDLADEIRRRLNERDEQLRQHEQETIAMQCQALLDKHGDIVAKFLDIAERKVSILDDYGDERIHLLPKEVDACIVKIAGREGLDVGKGLREGFTFFLLPEPLQRMRSRLPELFAEYHVRQKSKLRTKDEVSSLSGAEFETYVARILQQNGWEVSATPATGDQGADLVASKADRKVVIQAKRYTGSVGNHAVQEVVGAVRFYNGTEGCVVTNSVFTPSARALAQKNNIRLIDGDRLEELVAL